MKRNSPDLIRTWLQYTENTEPPPLFHEWAMIGLISSILLRSVKLEIGFLKWFPNFYIVLIGPSGVRKSTALDPIRDIMEKLGLDVCAESITREQLINRMDKIGKDMKMGPDNKLSHSAAITICNDEFTVFLKKHDIAMLDMLTDLYGCKTRWKYETKNMGSNFLKNTWLGILAATTPVALQSSLPPEALGQGFTSRMIFVYQEKKGKVIAIPTLSESQDRLGKKLFEDLENLKLLHGTFKLSSDFVDTYEPWVYRTEKEPAISDPRFDGYNSRRRTTVLKLSMIMSINRSEELVIRKCDFDKALNLLERTEPFMPYALSGIGQREKVDVINEVMKTIRMRQIVTFTDLLNKFWHDINSRELEVILETLQEQKYCKIVQKEGQSWIEINSIV